MPYKDPERKRQWEREHRELRNERRRTSRSTGLPEPSGVEAPMPDPISGQESEPGMNMVVFLTIGFTFLLLMLFAGWCSIAFRGRADVGERL